MLVAFLLGSVLGFIASRQLYHLWRRHKCISRDTHLEFWVYIVSENFPTIEKVLPDLAKAQALGTDELTLISDVRLSMGRVLRSKNPHVFRPDLFEDYIEPTPEILKDLAAAQGMVRLRFTSSVALDGRERRLLPTMAFVVGRQADSKVIFDAVLEKLYTLNEFGEVLRADRRMERPESQTRVIWKTNPLGVHAETRGLSKRGWPEVETAPIRSDQKLLVSELFERFIDQVWDEPLLPKLTTVTGFGDEFEIALEPKPRGNWLARIRRIQMD